MKRSDNLKNQTRLRLPAIIAAVLFVAVFGLYYLGIYDISFIERPKAWQDNINLLADFFSGTQKTDITEPADTEPAETQPTETAPPTVSTGVHGTLPDGFNAVMSFAKVSELSADGYTVTDKVYNSQTCVFGIMDPGFSWPKSFSYGEKTYDKEVITTYEDGTESTRDVVRDKTARPSLELYMGYIIYDDRGTQYLIGPDGTVLTQYDDESYIPAYTRDSAGHPLFYRPYSYTVDYPTETAEPDENGNSEWVKKESITVTGKQFYYLNEDSNFVRADYNDVTENRGLYFDYPSYYGLSDTNLDRYCRNTTKLFTSLDGKTTVLNCMKWLFSSSQVDLSELEFNQDGTNKEEGGDDLDTMFPYTMAYNFSGGFAVVQKDIRWDYTHEIENEDGSKENETVDVTSSELRVIDKYGIVKFDSRKNYFSELGWTANERYVAPLSLGLDSIGSCYFDHGLLRLRVQSYDRYYFTDLDTVKIVSDEDVLVSSDGTKFDIPGGFKLKYYSDGILCLEKDGKFGYLNYSGAWISETDMVAAGPFLEGVAVCSENGTYGVIDTTGKTVIPFKYDYISNISGGTVACYSKDSGWTVYQKMSKS